VILTSAILIMDKLYAYQTKDTAVIKFPIY